MVLSTATYTRQSNLANHLKSAHGRDPRNARGCRIPFRKFATCGICKDDVLFTDYKTEEAHLWDAHWQRGHSMDMWVTDHEIWKLICLRPGVYEAWQKVFQQHCSSSKQDHVSWTHVSSTDMQLLRLELKGDFLDDYQIAKRAFEKAKIFLNVPASQVRHSPAHSTGAPRHVYCAGSNHNDRETHNGQAAADDSITNSRKQAQRLRNHEILPAGRKFQPNCPLPNDSRRDMTSLLEDVPTATQGTPTSSNPNFTHYIELPCQGTPYAVAPASLTHSLLKEQERLKTRNASQLMLTKELPPTPVDTKPMTQATLYPWSSKYQQGGGLNDVINSPPKRQMNDGKRSNVDCEPRERSKQQLQRSKSTGLRKQSKTITSLMPLHPSRIDTQIPVGSSSFSDSLYPYRPVNPHADYPIGQDDESENYSDFSSHLLTPNQFQG
ncbi:MAG: hypothetical protein Q9167_004839 [Letrouitia subvulpina]